MKRATLVCFAFAILATSCVPGDPEAEFVGTWRGDLRTEAVASNGDEILSRLSPNVEQRVEEGSSADLLFVDDEGDCTLQANMTEEEGFIEPVPATCTFNEDEGQIVWQINDGNGWVAGGGTDFHFRAEGPFEMTFNDRDDVLTGSMKIVFDGQKL